MERIHYFACWPTPIRCYECKHEGPSQLQGAHQVFLWGTLVLAVAITWLTGTLPESWMAALPARPFLLGSVFGPRVTPLLVATWWVVWLSFLFSIKAHRCRSCGSPWIQSLATVKHKKQ